MSYLKHNITCACWGEVKNEKWDLAVLPWGATEPHGYHLPYCTDNLLAERVAAEAAVLAKQLGTNAMVLPAVPFGQQNPGQVELPFCINVTVKTMREILKDVVGSLSAQGINKLVILVGHGGNSYSLRALVREFSVRYPSFRIAVCEYFKIFKDKSQFFSQPVDDHAGEEETSMMLHWYPELVRMDLAGTGESHPCGIPSIDKGTGWMPRNWAVTTADTGVGYPREASAEKGARYIEAILPLIARLFADIAGL